MHSTFNLQFTVVSPTNAILSIDKQINNQHISWPRHSYYQPMMTALFSLMTRAFLNEPTHYHASPDYNATNFVITCVLAINKRHTHPRQLTVHGNLTARVHKLVEFANRGWHKRDPVDACGSGSTYSHFIILFSVGRKTESHFIFMVGDQMIHSVKCRTNHEV